jgi:cytochrome c oxidase accessory protein FixG
MLLFLGLPFLRIGGKPALLFDIAAREFDFFGATLRATDGVLLMLSLLLVFVTIFLVTAWVGRAWCGFACPQTVYLEFLFRPLERWIEGGLSAQKRLDQTGPNARRVLKYAVFLLLSILLAHVFLAYFVGDERLARWVTRSPFEHPGGFLVVGITAALIFADFGFFREQLCTIACPYARLQSALIDPTSLVVGYDQGRGEPRGRGEGRGDCIDCQACVVTCPTGIDIREGQQLECVACAQCIDACDSVMLKFGRAPGLIRYAAAREFAGPLGSGAARPRVTIPPGRWRLSAYALLLLGLLCGLFAYGRVANRPQITLLRGIGAPFELSAGRVRNQIRIKIENRTREAASYQIELSGADGTEFVAPENPVQVAAGARATTSVFVTLPLSAFRSGQREIKVVLRDRHGVAYEQAYRLLGPEGAHS